MNLCLPGYTGANCEKCKPAKMSADYNLSQYNASIHTMTEKGGYSEYRCTDITKGFKSANEKNQCITCPTPGGVDASGKCMTCASGTVYTKNTSSSGGYCRTATKYSQSDMRYGKGKDSSIEVNKQCWTFTDPEAYAKCVKGVSTLKVLSIKNLSSSALKLTTAVSNTSNTLQQSVSSSFLNSNVSAVAPAVSSSYSNVAPYQSWVQ